MEIRIGSEGEFLLLSDEYEGSSTRSDEGQLSWIHAELSLSHLRASTKVGIVWGVDASLSEFFDDVAKNWRGWKGAKKWEAYEGGLGLSCRLLLSNSTSFPVFDGDFFSSIASCLAMSPPNQTFTQSLPFGYSGVRRALPGQSKENA